jgi:hypothetical protein
VRAWPAAPICGAVSALLAGCSLPPVDLHTAAPGGDAPVVGIIDSRGVPDPAAVGAQLPMRIWVASRPVPDVIHDAVAAALARHGIQRGALRMTVRVGRFGIDVASQGSFHDTAQAVWGVFVSDGAGLPRCAVEVHVFIPVESANRAAALQAALDQAAEQASAAATCPQGTGL